MFITASSFSREARANAQQVSDGLALVDGRLLTKLLIEYEVGVSVEKVVKVVGVDRDFFEEL